MVVSTALDAGSEGLLEDKLGERILDAAMSQFALLGIRRSSIDNVARRARVGRVTVFRKFQSKDGLVEAVVLREAARVMQMTERAIDGLDTLEDKIVEGYLSCFKAVIGHPLLRLVEIEPETMLPLLTVNAAPALALGQAVLAPHIEAAGASSAEADRAAELLTRIGLSLVLTPSPTLRLRSDAEIRAFADRYLVPIATTAADNQDR